MNAKLLIIAVILSGAQKKAAGFFNRSRSPILEKKTPSA